MNALDSHHEMPRCLPVQRLQTAGTHRGVHRASVGQAFLIIIFARHKLKSRLAGACTNAEIKNSDDYVEQMQAGSTKQYPLLNTFN